MNAITILAPYTDDRRSLAVLHLAARVLAYPVASGELPYSSAVSALIRTGLREGLLDEAQSFDDQSERLEASINRAITDIFSEASNGVRAMIALCRERGQPSVVIREAALCADNAFGNVLPISAIDFLLAEAAETLTRGS